MHQPSPYRGSDFATLLGLDAHQEAAVILWHDLNFWTAVGQLGIGVMAGLAVGIILQRVRRLARSSTRRTALVCPRCGAQSLQRSQVASAQAALGVAASQSKYVCARCGWPAPPASTRTIRFTSRRSTNAKMAVRQTSAVEKPEPVEEAPEADSSTAFDPAAAMELDETVSRMDPKDDTEQVKDAIYYYLALLNAGDVTVRANCCLSDFTNFAPDGGPLQTGRSERRPNGPTSPFNLRCRDLRVYIYKETAIATAYVVGTTTTNGNQRPTRISGRSSWVLLRQNGEWKIAHSHASPLNPEI
jgi:ketosteroid isomerase-like protein/predicted RNA-binding Zn-ribbon protein involved in translation (DUF1610 family)